MSVQSNPKIFVITLSTTPTLSKIGELNKKLGEPFLLELTQSLIKQECKYELFPAQDGYLMTNEHWKSEEIPIVNHCDIVYCSGALGCLYSHLQLWKKCIHLNDPIIILEHDALVLNSLKKIITNNYELIKLGQPFPNHIKNNPVTGIWRMGAWGYYITPQACNILIHALKQYGTLPVDVLMGDKIINWSYSTIPHCELNHASLLQSSTGLRNEKISKRKWTNPFMTKEELVDWLEFVFKKRNLKLVFESENKHFNDNIKTVSDTFDLLLRNTDNNLIVQSVFTGDVYELEVDKIKELYLV